MSKFDLRDISQRLSASKDTEAVVFEFLGYLQDARSDWRASLSFYEVSRDSLVNVYSRHGGNLVRRDVTVAVDQLPPKLVRKFFHPSAFFNGPEKKSLLSNLFKASRYYEPDSLMETSAIQPLCPNPSWQTCICLPLADQEDLLALLILVSDRKGSFRGHAIDEIIPVKNMAALALAQRLYKSARRAGAPAADETAVRAAATEFQDRIKKLNAETSELAEENRIKSDQLDALNRELESLDRNSSEYQQELERVKSQLFALEEQSSAAAEHLRAAQSQVHEAMSQVLELQRTISFMKEVFQVLGQEYDVDSFTRTMVTWFCEHFGVQRCSLMLLGDSPHTLHIAAYRGLDPGVADQVRVRIGQGIAGWVAHHRKPLLMRVKSDTNPVQHTGQDAYNSDSFISVPLVFNSRLSGVLNLSNKSDGAPFDELDLDRAVLTASVIAMILGSRDLLRRPAQVA